MFAKPIATIAIILLSATALTAEANAGGCHGGGFRFYSAGPSYSVIKRRQSLAAAKLRREQLAAAKLRQQKAALAAASKKAEAAKVAKAETPKQDEASTAKIAKAAPAKAPEATSAATETKVAAAEPTTCKKFVPAIGATVDVACEQKN